MERWLSRSASPAARIVLGAALVAGFSYAIVAGVENAGKALILWKGLGVWLLAIFALLSARDNDGWLLVGVMSFGALGDVLVERNLEWGALAFAIGHIIAIALYLRNRRTETVGSQRLLAYALLPLVPAIGWLLTADIGVAIYCLLLAAMAATAWLSRFPRYRTGIGAMLFVASDLLIFAQMGPLGENMAAAKAVWLLYFAGQALIALGVTRTLGRDFRVSLR